MQLKKSVVVLVWLALLLWTGPAFADEAAQLEVTAGGAFDVDAWRAVLTVSGLVALVTLAGLEIVLGIDNIVFITVLTARLPPEQRPRGRRLGLMAAMISRIVLLLFVGWLIQLTKNLFQIPFVNADDGVSGKDLILIAGGAFLLVKAVREIHVKVNDGSHEDAPVASQGTASFGSVLVQIMIVDLVFSLDSVITAVGMTANIPVMIVAVVASVAVMMVAANPIADFVEQHPAIKILALSFLVLIGVLLLAEGLGQHLDKGYIYFAMAFALVVELLQIRMQDRSERSVA